MRLRHSLVIWRRYLHDEQYRALQCALASTLDLGVLDARAQAVFRKLRWTDVRRGKGRCGGLRVVYYWFDRRNQIWLMTIYNKNEAADLRKNKKIAEDSDRR